LLELKAVYSRSLASAQSLVQGAPGSAELYSDEKESKNYAHLLQRDDIQAVILALPIPVQPEYIIQALAAGKHVLAEKPIAEVLSRSLACCNHEMALGG
jgi:predicted dehydrogenase